MQDTLESKLELFNSFSQPVILVRFAGTLLSFAEYDAVDHSLPCMARQKRVTDRTSEIANLPVLRYSTLSDDTGLE